MKLNRLTINNFYRYYGKQEIVFSTDNDKNVTVLRGENGAGKTTLLNAFYWVMYGDVMEPLTIKGMLNNRAAEEMKNSSIETSYIKLEFEDRGTEYTILRKQKFIKQNNVIKPNSIEKPYIEYRDKRTGNSIEITEKDLRDLDMTTPAYLAQYGKYYAILSVTAENTGIANVELLQLDI